MRWLKILGPVLVVLGLIGLTISVLNGDMEFHLLLIIPVISISGPVGIISVLTAITGGMMILFSAFGRHHEIHRKDDYNEQRKREGGNRRETSESGFGGIIFLGPFPIVFGNRSFREKLPGWLSLLFIGVILFVVLQLLLMIIVILI